MTDHCLRSLGVRSLGGCLQPYGGHHQPPQWCCSGPPPTAVTRRDAEDSADTGHGDKCRHPAINIEGNVAALRPTPRFDRARQPP